MALAAKESSSKFEYERHKPEQSLLYQAIQCYWPSFVAHCEAQNQPVPSFVKREFEAYLRLAHGAAYQAGFAPRKVESVTLLLAYHGHDALFAGHYAQLHKYRHHNTGVSFVAVIEFDAALPSYLEAKAGAYVEVAVKLPYVAAVVAKEVPAFAVACKAKDAAYFIGSNIAALVQTFRFWLAVAEGVNAG